MALEAGPGSQVPSEMLPETVVPDPGADLVVSVPPSEPIRSVMFCTPMLARATVVS